VNALEIAGTAWHTATLRFLPCDLDEDMTVQIEAGDGETTAHLTDEDRRRLIDFLIRHTEDVIV
jgi:hypothetical protein